MALKGRVVDSPVDIGQFATPVFARVVDLDGHYTTRAERLDALAAGNPLEPFLRFVAAIARAQQRVLADLPAASPPSDDHVAFCKAHGFAPVDRLTWHRDPGFLVGARAVAKGLAGTSMPLEASEALRAFAGRDDASLDGLADRFLRWEAAPWEAGELPFVAAALDLYWTRMAAALDAAILTPLENRALCPVCASPPVASVIEVASGRQGSRFLCCSMCATRWNYVRVKCSACESTEGVAYQHVEGGSRAVRAETCDTCKSYAKVIHLDEAPDAEPVADDLATVGLDILVSEAGWGRACPNLYLLPEASEEATEPLSRPVPDRDRPFS